MAPRNDYHMTGPRPLHRDRTMGLCHIMARLMDPRPLVIVVVILLIASLSHSHSGSGSGSGEASTTTTTAHRALNLINTVSRYQPAVIAGRLQAKGRMRHQVSTKAAREQQHTVNHTHPHHHHNLWEVHLFISVTSGPGDHNFHLRQAARDTWLLPCMISQHCEYRFFVDSTAEYIPHSLMQESESFNDIVFRDNCTLINARHPPTINYGNCKLEEHSFNNLTKEEIDNVYKDIEKRRNSHGHLQNWEIPDYLLRYMYKIDWKVCFLKWAAEARILAHYHVFVEDDSFMCTENLLHQVSLLTKQQSPPVTPFRVGWPKIDAHGIGFDDSSSFFSREVAEAFERWYLTSPEFNCSNVLSVFNDSTRKYEFADLSWGNSWQGKRCDWREALKRVGININSADLNCLSSTAYAAHSADIALAIDSPCMDYPLILHGPNPAEGILEAARLQPKNASNKLPHLCEHMLLIDKVKSPHVIFTLWNAAVEQTYHDYTPVLKADGLSGWEVVINAYFSHKPNSHTQQQNRLMENTTLASNISSNRRLERMNKPTGSLRGYQSHPPDNTPFEYFFHSLIVA